MQLRKYFIGIDGGGTKTTGVIGDASGRIHAKVRGRSSNIQSKPVNEVKEVFLRLIRDLTAESGINYEQIEAIYFSLAGCGRLKDKERVLDAIRPDIGRQITLVVENDAMGALAAGTWGEPGIVLIAGTGSIAYICSSQDQLARVGGWGYLLGDEGSGYEIGKKGLAAVLKQHDGRGPMTELTKLLLDRFNLLTPDQLVSVVYSSENVKETIASVSKVVFQAELNGDSVAMKITDHAVDDLVNLVRAAQEMGKDASVPLVISGGLFSSQRFKDKFVKKVQSQLGEFPVIHPLVPPEIGAFILALKHSGFEISNKKKELIRRNWAHLEEGSV